MFYDTSWVEAPPAPHNGALATVVLTPAESKRLIGKAVAALPEVRRAREQGRLIITRSTSSAYVAEELLGEAVPKNRFAAGIICQGLLATVPREERLHPFVLKNGERLRVQPEVLLQEFEAEDVYIKSANAVDMDGNAGVLVASNVGGTIGLALSTLSARGCHLIIPVGLEKLVPSVTAACFHMGTHRQRYSTGMLVGLIPVVTGKVVTETQALRVLAGVTAHHVASGGVGGSEGSVVLALSGDEATVDRAWELVQGVKGEPPVPGPSRVSLEL